MGTPSPSSPLIKKMYYIEDNPKITRVEKGLQNIFSCILYTCVDYSSPPHVVKLLYGK
jgi:hypothetical protein